MVPRYGIMIKTGQKNQGNQSLQEQGLRLNIDFL